MVIAAKALAEFDLHARYPLIRFIYGATILILPQLAGRPITLIWKSGGSKGPWMTAARW